jgi:hypothetical protein
MWKQQSPSQASPNYTSNHFIARVVMLFGMVSMLPQMFFLNTAHTYYQFSNTPGADESIQSPAPSATTDAPTPALVAISTTIPTPAPVATSTNYLNYDGETFSACLMWMDDYARLGEWIAYHYHVLPLRYLVLFRDPKSSLDPRPILDRWRSLMNITYWTNESSFMSDAALNKLSRTPKSINHHRLSQREFYRSCFQHLQENNRTWTLVIDTDEFLGIKNQVLLDTSSVTVQKPGIVMDMLKASHQGNQSLIDFGKGAKKKDVEKLEKKWGGNCIGMLRMEITSFESKREEVLKDVPSFLDGYRFVTMRFRHLGGGIIGKSLIDVSKYNITASTEMNAHHLIGECNKVQKWGAGGDIMYVNHYLGSWELFDRPNDKRKSKFGSGYRVEEFIKKNKRWNTSYAKSGNFGRGDEIRPWLQAFADYFGQEKRSVLLEDVGLPYNESTALQPPSIRGPSKYPSV